MNLRPPVSIVTDTLFPYTPVFRFNVLVHVLLAAPERLAREDDRDTEYASIVDHQGHVPDPVVLDAIQDDHEIRFLAMRRRDIRRVLGQLADDLLEQGEDEPAGRTAMIAIPWQVDYQELAIAHDRE